MVESTLCGLPCGDSCPFCTNFHGFRNMLHRSYIVVPIIFWQNHCVGITTSSAVASTTATVSFRLSAASLWFLFRSAQFGSFQYSSSGCDWLSDGLNRFTSESRRRCKALLLNQSEKVSKSHHKDRRITAVTTRNQKNARNRTIN